MVAEQGNKGSGELSGVFKEITLPKSKPVPTCNVGRTILASWKWLKRQDMLKKSK